jgi:hypothetical protein
VQPARAALAAGQRHVQRLGAQLGLQLGVGQRVAARLQRASTRCLVCVDRRAARLLLVDAECAQALEQFGQRPGLAEETRLGVLELGRRRRGVERRARRLHQCVQIVHGLSWEGKRWRLRWKPVSRSDVKKAAKRWRA